MQVDNEVVLELRDDEVLLPGLVDTHLHVNEPGRTECQDFEMATRAAAAGDVTTILDLPLDSIPPTVDVAALEVKRRPRRASATSTSVAAAAGCPATSATIRWVRVRTILTVPGAIIA